MTIIGLDMALKTGWAIVASGRVYESGVLNLAAARESEGAHNGHAFLSLYRWIDEHASDDVLFCYELAHHRGGPATRLACGYQAVLHLFAAKRSLPCPMSVHTSTLKKWATGSGRASKADMLAYATERSGKILKDDNEADAIAVALWGFAQACQTYRQIVGERG